MLLMIVVLLWLWFEGIPVLRPHPRGELARSHTDIFDRSPLGSNGPTFAERKDCCGTVLLKGVPELAWGESREIDLLLIIFNVDHKVYMRKSPLAAAINQ
jgi:hypothetical protein